MTRSENSCLEDTTTYTPLGTLALVDVEIYTVQFRPQEVLTPEIRVHKERKSFVFRQVACKVSKWRPSLPTEITAEMTPLLITRKGGTKKSIAWMATGANRRAISERKTILVNTSRDIAASSFGCVGDPRAGALGIRK
jgi:hypothetical protein